ncbi:hypothetical protein [Bdellovibrio sp. BCCA]|uniref:hypothetical protein n=1 Tax=Bdellovibrio sp. BCCA TaxID=3136281 RepID=UPI0030F101C0
MRMILAALLLMPALSWAHGEDKPGPAGGHIRMPGPFHTELMLDKEQGAHIFLIDMNFQNPTVKDSKIEMVAKYKKSEVKFNCSIMGANHFHCVPEKKYPNKGELIVKAVRENAVGNPVSYKLPLPEFKTKEFVDPHAGHMGH